MKNLLLIVLVCFVASCAISQPTPPKPENYPLLDSSLAAPCKIPEAPDVKDYDALQLWVESVVLVDLGDCAIRHRDTVAAWPKNPTK